MSTETEQAVVKVERFGDLSVGWSLALDNYQRPYVWDNKKVNQLLEDLYEFQEKLKATPNKKYYFGALLLHHSQVDKKRFVIDGQQRLTTLSVLYSILNKSTLPEWIDFEYRSHASVKNILLAKQTLQKQLQTQMLDLDIFRQFEFTTITVSDQDLAFTFFDTQNNRGVPLKSTDLLKAYHLRAIEGQGSDSKVIELYQSHCAQRWESVQTRGEQHHQSEGNDFAPELFHYFLWRARSWRGADVALLESRNRLYTAFGESSRPSNDFAKVSLYADGGNKWADSLHLLPDNEYHIQMSSIRMGQNAAHLPFAIRQPIEAGVGFFLYAEKYAALLNWVFHDSNTGIVEIENMQKLYKQVVCSLSIYLRRLFQLAVLMYVDRLGTDQLDVFAEWFNYRLAAMRLMQSDIRKETPIKYLRDRKINLLDVIAYAYDSIEVIDFIQNDSVEDVFEKEDGWAELIKEQKGVQGKYAKSLADFYGISHLKNLRNCIGKSGEMS